MTIFTIGTQGRHDDELIAVLKPHRIGYGVTRGIFSVDWANRAVPGEGGG